MMGDWDDPIPVRFPEGDRERIEQFAEQEGMSRAEAIRRLVDRGLIVRVNMADMGRLEVSHAAD